MFEIQNQTNDQSLAFGDTLESVTTRSRSRLPLNIQLFAGGGASGDGGNEGGDDGNPDNTGDDNTKTGADDSKQGDDNKGDQSDDKKDAIDKIVQSRVDRAMADERKKTAALQKELEKFRKEKLSAEELKQLEIEEREQAIADKQKEITDKENRLFAIQAIKEAGLDDGGDTSALVDLVVAGVDVTEDSITDKVKAVKTYIDTKVASEVDKTFKDNGRNPNGANSNNKDKTDTIAERLGKGRAEQNKVYTDVLNHYTGGKK